MAALVLGVAGQAIGAEIGGTLLGIGAGTIGGLIGSTVGSVVDNWLFSSTTKQTGPRLTDVNIQASTEGAAIPRIDGYMRLAGQIIWATKFKESSSTQSQGGKGGGPSVQTTSYSYSISFAVGICGGVVHKMGRVWADGNLLDMSKYTTRFYQGTEDQSVDPLVEEIEGAGNNPSYRGLCYVVFEDMDLTAFGNRIPQLQFELIRSITADRPDALENVLLGVNLIPGAGEFVYETDVISSDDGSGGTSPQNQNNASGETDALASLDDLQAIAPNMQSVSLVVGWFGDDLRAGSITIKPGVEAQVKDTYPETWSVNGVARADARLVSQIDDRPAYGGTPSDHSVVQIIQNMKLRGWRVNFYPFLFMDVAAGNSLPNPYSNNAATTGQPTYPWRGRITCSPAAGFTGTVDKTSTAATQVANFFGTAAASDLSVSGETVSWTGGSDWGFRRMILHYAKLCAAAGGVDTFIIGSEFRGLTQTRSASTTYPAVTALKTLAADVKSIFTTAGQGSTQIGYAADWSEYNNHQTGDAAGAVQFNLDPLWADSHIDFIGIDNYMPLADWRDGNTHLDFDAVNGPVSINDRAYLQRNIKGGEDYDWFYASQADRDSQTRTPITDAVIGKPWVWRAKDIWNWWSNAHYDRVSGTESGSPTAWTAQSKPIRFTELGCPAVDKGANEPNVFVDPKSSESFFPYYSNGQRDDLMQRAFLEAHLNYWTVSANNPVSTVYDAPMVDTNNINIWCWDARPYPFFPQRADIWGDAANYDLGHWLNGRLGSVMLADLVAEICGQSGFTAYDVSGLTGLVTGYARTSTMSARDELTPLMAAYFFDGVETQGVIRFVMRGQAVTTAISEDDLVVDPDSDPAYSYAFTRGQDDDLPLASRISFIDAGNGYQQGVYQSKRLVGNSNRVQETQVPLVMDRTQAGGMGDRMLQDAWLMRETGSFALPPYMLALDPADEIVVTASGRARRMRVTEIDDATGRQISSVATDPSIYENFAGPARENHISLLPAAPGRAVVVYADLPLLSDDAVAWAPYVGAFASPWAGQELIYRSPSLSGYVIDTAISQQSMIGESLYDFYSGPTWRWDQVNNLYVKLYNGTLESGDPQNGEAVNALAIQNSDGGWEIVQFQTAEVIGTQEWKLTGLLRGQRGTEQQMRNPVSAGARVLVLDTTLSQLGLSLSQFSATFNYLWGPAGKSISDPSYQSGTFSFAGVGMMPFSPAEVRFSWAAADLGISWKRRDRNLSADSWDQVEIPMSETSELYDLEILSADGSAVVRSLTDLPAAAATYTAAMQAADYPSGIPNPLIVRMYQKSSVVGRGNPATQQLWTR
jgi:hypothetical protein